MATETQSTHTAARPWLTGFRLALIILAFQLAMIPFGHATRGGSLMDIYASDFDKRGFNAGPDAWIAWKTYANWHDPAPVERYGIWGLFYARAGAMCSFVVISFVWTIGLNVLAVLWLGRPAIAHAWRTRPRLPKVRITIERRPRTVS